MSEITRRKICEGVNFLSIDDKRFKRGRIGAALIVPLSRETASANALLSCVLTRTCKKYPDFTAMNRKLNSLYGASLYPNVSRISDYQTIMISGSCISDRFTYDGSSVSAELTDLLCSMLLEPNLTNGLFPEDDVEQERRQLIENIDAEFNDKRIYAINRCIRIMCADEPYAIGRYGSRSDVEKITNQDLVRAWNTLLQNARMQLMMLGDSDTTKAYNEFSSFLSSKPRRTVVKSAEHPAPSEVKRVTETEEISQSKLVMGYKCSVRTDRKGVLTNTLMGLILGGMPISKLFVNVREKQSLCYYCAASVNSHKGILMVDSGVETENIEKTEQAIAREISSVIHGDVSDDELNSAKLMLKNIYRSSLDSLAALQSHYLSESFYDEPLTPLEAAAIADSVTKEDIIQAASSIRPDTVFTLLGNG